MDYRDYEQNPGKYPLFRTAVIKSDIHTHNGENDLPARLVVGVSHRFDAYNATFRRMEPVYRITLPNGKRYGADLYGSALTDFVL